MTRVRWLEQTEADVPAANGWLSASERERLDSLRFPSRRADWRLGRWTAKRALAAYLGPPGSSQGLANIEIRSAPSGAPEAFVDGRPAGAVISLSHRAGVASCAVAPPGTALGCDLEVVEPRGNAFIADYFTSEEQESVARTSFAERPRTVALLWSGKESALKALRVGLRLDTRSLVVSMFGTPRTYPRWRPLVVRLCAGRAFYGWWQHSGDLVRTVVATPPSLPPLLLGIE